MTNPPAAVRFTPSQQRAIKASGHGILVSAAAGSGKTATLTQRVVSLITDRGATVDQFIVLTFTENAAAEMQSRIERALIDAARASDNHDVRTQALLAGRLAISTVHGFCSRLIRQHFTRLGIDPAFKVLPEPSASGLRRRAVREVLDSAYGTDAQPPLEGFEDLLSIFAGDDEHGAAEMILELNRFLSTLTDRDAWCRQALGRLSEAVESPMTCALRSDLLEVARQRIADFRARAHVTIELAKQVPPLANLIRSEVLPILDAWDAEVGEPPPVGKLWRFSAYGKSKAQSIKEKSPHVEFVKEQVKKLRDKVAEGPLPDGLTSLADVDAWRATLVPVLPAVGALVELCGRFDAAYARLKREATGLDFADLEHFALRLLQTQSGGPSPLARELARRHPHVLIDECQDINPIQDRLISLLSGEAEHGPAGSHLFSVGDLKQSIYRFRLAAPELFQARQKNYEAAGVDAEVIGLTENFRSRPALLTAVNRLFSRLMVGGRTEINYADGHALVPGTDPPGGTFAGSPMELHLLLPKDKNIEPTNPEDDDDAEDLDQFEREADFIAHRIGQIVRPRSSGAQPATVADRDAPGGTRPARYGDIAILLRTAKVKSSQVAAMLRRRGVPARAEARGGLLETQEVQDLLAVLTLLEDPSDEPALLTYLRSPIAAVADVDDHLARARLAQPDATLHAAIVAHAGACEPLGQALRRLEPWRALAARRPVGEVLATICRDTHYREYALGQPDGLLRRAAIDELSQLADTFSDSRGDGTAPGPTAAAFVQFVRQTGEESELSHPTPPARSDDAVTVLTIHKSKGLEFPIVFVPDLGKKINSGDLWGKLLFGASEGLAPQAADTELKVLYPSPAWSVARARRRPRLVAEELRVLYVALTRAREHVILVGTAKPGAWIMAKAEAQSFAALTALPEPSVMDVSSSLEWILAAGAHAEIQGEGFIDVKEWAESDLSALTATAGIQPNPKIPAEVRRLMPLPGVPVPDRAVADAIADLEARLSARYPHAAAAHRAAAISVTAATHPPTVAASPAAPTPSAEPTAPPLPFSRNLGGQSLSIAATDRGTATHVALEHYDFRIDPTDAAVEAHLNDLRRRHILSDLEVGAVEPGAFRFLADSELGPLLRGERGALHAELPIYLPGDEGEGLDRQMIRGRIDLLVDTADGPVIIDYKSDHVWGERLEERIRMYQGQVDLYRKAAQAITGKPAAGVYLAFVHERARRIVRFGADGRLQQPAQ